MTDIGRRQLVSATVALAGFVAATGANAAEKPKTGAGQDKEPGAVEDLMREHGVLRRALLVYREIVPTVRSSPAKVDAKALNRTATLFRSFGEDYHEKKLEEAHIFPVVRKAGGPAAAYPDVLTVQHNRGREVTDYILAVTASGSVSGTHAEPLAQALESFVAMYQNHAAREDTIVFPAWKTALSQRAIDAFGEQFEAIEKAAFGHDGFDDAVRQIGEIERAFGIADLAHFTPARPPKA